MAEKSRRACAAVLDVGKTLAKLTLWSPERRLIGRKVYRNKPARGDGYPALDVWGLDAWLKESLTGFASQHDVSAIVPIAHGAAAAVIEDDCLSLVPVDYEAELPDALRLDYLARRNAFSVTGSPCLPCGLNLGAQLHWLEALAPGKFARGRIVTWPQYWAWRLCGVAATETSSLGCHTDLWNPAAGQPSPMAESRGWSTRLAPLHKADEVLREVTREWRDCGLPADCVVLCGAHDSNAALVAARGYPEVGGRDCTILSTGTWFIAMRSLPERTRVDLPEDRDCLFNVDVAGLAVPSARFMGGREAELIEAGEPLDVSSQKANLVAAAGAMARSGVFAFPTFHKGVGPFPKHEGRWIKRPDSQLERRAVTGLYLALVAGVSLNLIGSNGPLVVEGRFAGDPVFTGALAALRDKPVTMADAHESIAYGALFLLDGELPPQAALRNSSPLSFDIADYAAAWGAQLTG